jgi:hypothetical protein
MSLWIVYPVSPAFSRKETLSSKARKRLREANSSLEKLGAELDDEREKLAQTLGEFGNGMAFEKTLFSLGDNLEKWENASMDLYPQILAYSQKLARLEAEVRRSISGCCLTPQFETDHGCQEDEAVHIVNMYPKHW